MSVWGWPDVVVILSSRPDVRAGTAPHFEEHWQGPHQICWNEANHVRAFELDRVLEEDAEHYKFRDVNGDTFELRPMTLELYEKHVRRHTVGKNRFETLEKLLAAMRREW